MSLNDVDSALCLRTSWLITAMLFLACAEEARDTALDSWESIQMKNLAVSIEVPVDAYVKSGNASGFIGLDPGGRKAASVGDVNYGVTVSVMPASELEPIDDNQLIDLNPRIYEDWVKWMKAVHKTPRAIFDGRETHYRYDKECSGQWSSFHVTIQGENDSDAAMRILESATCI